MSVSSNPTASHRHQQQKNKAVSQVLWRILVLNVLVAISKIAVGILTGTVSIIADGLHSAVDGMSNVIGLVAQRVATQPPDEDHPYGHERFETLATLAIGGLLMLTAWEVLQVAGKHLFSGEAPEVGVIQFTVLIVTLGINLVVTFYERKKAIELKSSLLSADSAHTASDVWVTISVIFSLIAVQLGLVWMDAVVALAIVVLIGYTAWGIVKQTSTVLVDAAPISAEDITQVITGTPGVQKIIRARSRGAEDAIHIDLDVLVASEISAELAHNINDAIRERITNAFPHTSEVRVQIVPNTSNQPDYLTAARAAADAMGLGVHEIIGVVTTEGKILEMHVEVPSHLTLDAAHQQVSVLEREIRATAPEIAEVVTHIEPAALNDLPVAARADELETEARDLLDEQYPGLDWHDLRVYPGQSGFAVSMHVTLPPQMTIEAAHRLAEDAELFLRSQMPQIARVTIHTEPPDATQQTAS